MELNTELFTAIANVGFPIVLSVILLWRFDKKFDQMKEQLTRLVALMEVLCKERLTID